MENKTNKGTMSVVAGIIGLFVLPFIFGPIGLIMGMIGMGSPDESNGASIAGIVLGIINVLFIFM